MSRNILSDRQKNFIIDAVKEKKEIIECKKNDLITNMKKNEVWNSIAEMYNITFNDKITSKTLNQLYRKWKSLARKEITESKRQMKATGGGPQRTKEYSATTSSLLDLDENMVFTISNPYDNDSNSNSDVDETLNRSEKLELTNNVSRKRTTKKETLMMLEHEKRMEVLEAQKKTYEKQQAAFDAMKEAEEAKKAYYQWMLQSVYGANSQQWYGQSFRH